MGQIHKFGNIVVKEVKLLSEGGYGYVSQCVDTATGKLYALKKCICGDKERYNFAKSELSFLVS